MLRLRQIVIAMMLVGFTPGLGELIEDGSHLLVAGHSAHAEAHAGAHEAGHADESATEHAGHGASDAEHGCTGWDHKCPCHSSVSFLHTSLPSIGAAGCQVENLAELPPSRGPAGLTSRLDRPPAV